MFDERTVLLHLFKDAEAAMPGAKIDVSVEHTMAHRRNIVSRNVERYENTEYTISAEIGGAMVVGYGSDPDDALKMCVGNAVGLRKADQASGLRALMKEVHY